MNEDKERKSELLHPHWHWHWENCQNKIRKSAHGFFFCLPLSIIHNFQLQDGSENCVSKMLNTLVSWTLCFFFLSFQFEFSFELASRLHSQSPSYLHIVYFHRRVAVRCDKFYKKKSFSELSSNETTLPSALRLTYTQFDTFYWMRSLLRGSVGRLYGMRTGDNK